MSADGFEGISETDLTELDQGSRAITGRDRLPFWFDGVTVDSAPANMMLQAMDELRIVEEEVGRTVDPGVALGTETRERLTDARERYRLLGEFHIGHRQRNAAGTPLLLAMARQYSEMEGRMLSGNTSWSVHPEKLRPFMDEIIVAYVSFYNTWLRDVLPPEEGAGQ